MKKSFNLFVTAVPFAAHTITLHSDNPLDEIRIPFANGFYGDCSCSHSMFGNPGNMTRAIAENVDRTQARGNVTCIHRGHGNDPGNGEISL